MHLLKQIIVITLLATVLGMVRFMFTDESYTLIKVKRELQTLPSGSDENGNARFRIPELLTEPMMIDLDFAKYLFDKNAALFIDAREVEEFEVAHIAGSINIPYDYSDEYKHLLLDVDSDSLIVTYCDGGECDLSIELGDYLYFDKGYNKILVFEGGLSLWQKEGYLTE